MEKSTICPIYLLFEAPGWVEAIYPKMGARTTCRVFKSDNTLALYFKLIFTTTHHFHLFGGSIEKPDVSFSLSSPLMPSQGCEIFSILWPTADTSVQVKAEGRPVQNQLSSAPPCRPPLLQTLWKCWSCCGSGEFSRSSTQKILLIRHLQADKHNTFPVDSKVLPPFGAQSPRSGIHSMFLPWSHWRLLRNGGIVCHQWNKAKFFTLAVRNKGLQAALVHCNVM